MFSLVIFDLDGTLVDTAPELAAAVNAALTECSLPAVDEAQVRGWIGHGARELVRRAYCHAAGADAAQADDPASSNALLQAFEWHYAAASGRSSRLFPGVVPALDALRKLGVATALLTNKESRFTAPLLHAHGLWERLDAVVCGDMLAQKKPHPLPVEHCLERLRGARASTLLVGDSEVDVATARNAGVAVWAVTYGYHCGRLRGGAQPDRMIPTIQSVADAVARTVPA